MHEVLKNSRHGCDLHGALQTLEELSGVAAVVHANAGCVYQHYLADRAGHLAGGSVYGPEIPSTEVIEKQIVFGGASRLREELKNAAKVIDGSLYIILGSCEAAMVGDDLAAMTKEATDIALPVIFYFSAGFKGGSHWGYANIMRVIIQQLPSVRKFSSEKIPGLVNVLGILPKADIFYKGDIREIKRLLETAGLTANTFFGPRDGVAELERSALAEHSLVFSHWGLAAAEQLKEQYGIPYTFFESLPLGIEGTAAFYKQLSSVIKIDETRTTAFLGQEEEQYRYYLKSLTDVYFGETLQKNTALVGDISTVKRISPFLEHSLGTVIHTAVLTDVYTHGKEEARPPVPEGLAGEVFKTDDSAEIDQILSDADVEMVLGSALEEDAAKRLKIPHLTISTPNGNQVLLHKTYAGITGAYFLLEDYASAVLRNNAEQREEKRRFLKSLDVFQEPLS
ncbi:oxidoreductase/nitrogenase, component 1 [Treponema primitia ZAS-2]|uniref:Oxidoreductase/nitrogenase, component 1 n=1 Tax=Treponema primitia (strain ATCC BAA-887 / DSM 12427 / ZAS-2) TaxID=545694 RepID=F5YLK0_TREPZ|nr:nitrogenase component 1 [Treponema primitia]AEF85372.1 oxidoreductase/nitrogenase, component 1 [Treponema primitia ZAS-2]